MSSKGINHCVHNANNEATVFVFEGDEGEPDEKKQKDDDATYEPSPKKVTSCKTDRNLTPLPALSEACDRYDLNYVAAAFIANATLQDYGLLSKSTAIDRKKLARERIKWRRRTKEEDEKKQKLRGIRGLYSDGRRDSTLQGYIFIFFPTTGSGEKNDFWQNI